MRRCSVHVHGEAKVCHLGDRTAATLAVRLEKDVARLKEAQVAVCIYFCNPTGSDIEPIDQASAL